MMDISIDDIIKVLQSGGNVALIFGIYFGGRVLTSIKNVITTFDTIAADVAHVRKKIDLRFPEDDKYYGRRHNDR